MRLVPPKAPQIADTTLRLDPELQQNPATLFLVADTMESVSHLPPHLKKTCLDAEMRANNLIRQLGDFSPSDLPAIGEHAELAGHAACEW